MEMANDLEVTEVYLKVRLLPDECYPAHIYRDQGVALVYVDPRASKFELVLWSNDNLHDDEANLIRVAYGQPPRREGRMSDAILEGQCDSAVPPELRLPGADYGAAESVDLRWQALRQQLTHS
jgi:hypothetical protein